MRRRAEQMGMAVGEPKPRMVADVRAISERVVARMTNTVVGSLRYYAEQCECDGEHEQAEMLTGIAGRIANGTATDEDWYEAFDQIDVSDMW